MEEYSVHGRGGVGMRNYNVTEKTGAVADVKMVNPGEDLLIISDDGTIIRMAVDNISLLGRSTQGVRVMRLMEGSRVISIEKTESVKEEEKPESEENED